MPGIALVQGTSGLHCNSKVFSIPGCAASRLTDSACMRLLSMTWPKQSTLFENKSTLDFDRKKCASLSWSREVLYALCAPQVSLRR